MKLTKTLTAGALALLVATAPAAMAKSKQTAKNSAQFEEMFKRFDANRDGFLTRAELGTYGAYFDHLDTNRDGRVTRAESHRVVQREGSRLRGMDTNRDGVITRREWRGNNTSFAQLDRNRDGVISQADGK